jgi:hypothetical protein
MTVFVSASDESDGGHHRSRFWHGGWVAPEKDWVTYFAPTWQKRVLDAEPSIPFLHTKDICDPGTISPKNRHQPDARLAWCGFSVTIPEAHARII